MIFVSFYDLSKNQQENRVFAPSIVACINYLCDCCHRLGIPAEIVSAAETRNQSGRYPLRREEITDGVTLTQCASHGHKNPLLRTLDKIRCRLWLVKYIIQNTKKGEIVFFWDSPVLYEPLLLIRLLTAFRKIKVLYFATEFFQELYQFGKIKSVMEGYLFSSADMLIVSTEFLNRRINPDGRDYAVLHGSYSVPEKMSEPFDDGKIHIVYAGIINEKKGSRQAVEVAKYLPDRYIVHILGYGTPEDLEHLRKSVEASNAQNNCKVIYEGLKSGDDYNAFLQQCHIGLCSQNLNEVYNNASFPSKILTYLSNGLRVVSVDMPTLRESEVGDLLFFTRSDAPEDIADVIKKMDFDALYDSRKLIADMDARFLNQFRQLIGE